MKHCDMCHIMWFYWFTTLWLNSNWIKLKHCNKNNFEPSLIFIWSIYFLASCLYIVTTVTLQYWYWYFFMPDCDFECRNNILILKCVKIWILNIRRTQSFNFSLHSSIRNSYPAPSILYFNNKQCFTIDYKDPRKRTKLGIFKTYRRVLRILWINSRVIVKGNR